MHKEYFITIIIVTYNAEKHIGHALESLTTRINDDIEVIVVDGKSTDRTLEIVEKYPHCVSKVISEKDRGIYDAMNKGVSLATGNYVLFLGADDKLMVNLNELKDYLIDNNTIYYGDVILYPSGRLYGGRFNTAKLLNRNICHQSIFYPSEVFNKYSFGSDYKLMEDYMMNLKLWNSKSFVFKYLEKTISEYNIEGISSTSVDEKFKKDSFKITFKYFGFYGILIKLFNPIRNFLNY